MRFSASFDGVNGPGPRLPLTDESRAALEANLEPCSGLFGEPVLRSGEGYRHCSPAESGWTDLQFWRASQVLAK